MELSSRALSRKWSSPRYKIFEKGLKKASSEWFQKHQYSVDSKYPYLLAKWNDWPNNIILPKVAAYIDDISRNKPEGNFPLHKYIHHGLSSQAMLFNLIGPLIVANDLNPIKDLIEQKGLVWKGSDCSAELEFEDRAVFNEDSGQPTSIDLVIKDKDGKPYLFFESKLSEKEFGGCSVYKVGDCDGQNPAFTHDICYLNFIGRKYWKLLEKHGFITGQITSDSLCVFVNNYQFFREVLFALEKNGIFILLSDERSPVFYSKNGNEPRGLMPYLMKLIPDTAKDRIANITIQELLLEIEKSGKHSFWTSQFREKYAL